jgi:predicted RNase H-like HicB family nuclease
MQELIFVVKESEEGGYLASGVNDSIFTDGATLKELKENIKEAVRCHFDDQETKLIRLHVVKEEIFSV